MHGVISWAQDKAEFGEDATGGLHSVGEGGGREQVKGGNPVEGTKMAGKWSETGWESGWCNDGLAWGYNSGVECWCRSPVGESFRAGMMCVQKKGRM